MKTARTIESHNKELRLAAIGCLLIAAIFATALAYSFTIQRDLQKKLQGYQMIRADIVEGLFDRSQTVFYLATSTFCIFLTLLGTGLLKNCGERTSLIRGNGDKGTDRT